MRFKFICLGVVFLLIIFSSVYSVTDQEIEFNNIKIDSNKLDSALIQEIGSGNNNVRVVVILKDDKETLSPDSVVREKAIKSKQLQTIQSIQSIPLPEMTQSIEITKPTLQSTKDIKNLKSKNNNGPNIQSKLNRKFNSKPKFELKQQFKTINAFSAEINNAKVLQDLVNDNNVKEIKLDYPVRISLDTSTSQINADQVWNIAVNGTIINGTGETVCIVDTGIDYTHSALGACNPSSYSLVGNVENLSTAVESAHDYTNNLDYTWTITKPGYNQIALHFVNITLEQKGVYDTTDRIYIYDQNNVTLAVYGGVHSDIWTPYADGDTLYVKLVTDGSVVDYGFYIDQTINGTTNLTMDWSNCSKVIGGWDMYNSDNNPMDDHGHGTHVAGIVASTNETYKGVAPGASLVALKALDSSGSGYSSDVAAAIEWCNTNSDNYNISVISMSLGCDGASCTHYQTYCNNDLTATAIQSAVAKNITVSIASGNNAWTDGISNPSCVENATPVGGVDSADNINYNRGVLLRLLAPSSNIYSSYLSNSWASLSGTSMATPHYSGSVALMRQYYRLAYNRVPTVKEVENKFVLTGKNTIDSASGLNFSRVDVLVALQPYLNFTLNSPLNNTNITINSTLINVTSDIDLYSVFLEFTNNNGTATNYSMISSGTKNFYYQLNNLSNGTYTYYVTGNDSINNFGVSESRTLIVTTSYFNVTVPSNNAFYNNSFNLNIFIRHPPISFTNYTIVNSSGDLVQSNSTFPLNSDSFTWKDSVDLVDGNYTLTVFANDSNNYVISKSVNFVVDKTLPLISGSLLSPAIIHNDNILTFDINVTELNKGTALLFTNHTGDWANFTMTNTNTGYNYSLVGNLSNQENVSYYYYISDLADNYNTSRIFNFVVQNRNLTYINITSHVNGANIEVGNLTLFTSSAIDPDNDSISSDWNFSGVIVSGENVSYQYNSTGSYLIILNVSDSFGSTLNTNITIFVNDTTAPTIDSETYDNSLHIESEINQSVTINVSDYSNVSSVNLYYNNSLISILSQSGNNYNWTWGGNFTNGTSSFIIETIDNYVVKNSINRTYNFLITSCSDGVDNGDEDGVDCGGSCSTSCSVSSGSGGSSGTSSGSSSGSSASGGGGMVIGKIEPPITESEIVEQTDTIPDEIVKEEVKALNETLFVSNDNGNKSNFSLVGMAIGLFDNVNFSEIKWSPQLILLIIISTLTTILGLIYYFVLREKD